jgi:hypothetical protein
VTLSLLGPLFAIFRPLAAFVTGIVGGTFVDAFERKRGDDSKGQPKCSDECCDTTETNHKIARGLKYGFVTLPRDIGKALMVGLIIAAVISALVPEGYFAGKLGPGILQMVVMMVLGIPVYVCATASVPVAAVLISTGLSPGAALVFLMTGPATNAASFITIWKVLGKVTAITYLATVAGCALLGGILLDYIAAGFDFEIATRHGWMLPPIVKHISAVALLAVLAFAILTKRKQAD